MRVRIVEQAPGELEARGAELLAALASRLGLPPACGCRGPAGAGEALRRGLEREGDADLACAAVRQARDELVALYRERLARMVADLRAALAGFERGSGALAKGNQPPAGFAPAPGSRRGAWRKRGSSGEWEYWYPSVAVTVSAESRDSPTPQAALDAVGDAHDQALFAEAKSIGRRLGLAVRLLACNFGIWEGDPDDSLTLDVAGRGHKAERRFAALAAVLGHLADQQAVLVVHADRHGPDVRSVIPLDPPRDPALIFETIHDGVSEGASIELDDERRAVRLVVTTARGSKMHGRIPSLADALGVAYDPEAMEEPCRMEMVRRASYRTLMVAGGLADRLLDGGTRRRGRP